MTEHIRIFEAVETDTQQMITVYCDSLEPDVLNTFLTGSPRRVDIVKQQTNALTSSLGRRFTSPTNRCHIHNAVDTRTGEIVGWSLVRWENGTITVPEKIDEGQSEPFQKYYVRRVLREWLNLCGGREHVVLGGLYVSPAYQRQGIGTLLVKNIYRLYDLENEPVVVQTRAMSEPYYKKMGWETLVSVDIDFSACAGEGRGYGLHRSPQMLRDPKGLLARRKAEVDRK